MRTLLLTAVVILSMTVPFITGCARKSTQRVAGTQETYRTSTTPTTVTVRYTDNGFTISPGIVPNGDIDLRIINNSKRTLQMQGVAGKTQSLNAGESYTTRVRNPQLGVYSVGTAR